MSLNNKILVIGGSGSSGRKVVKHLENKNQNVLVAGRDETKFENLKFSNKVSFVKFDYNNPETYKAAVENVDRVFLMAAPLDSLPEKSLEPFINFLKQLSTIKKIIFISAINAERYPIVKGENLVKGSTIPYTIIRAPFFMENLTDGFMQQELKGGSLSAPVGEHSTVWISTDDIGQVVANLFLDTNNTAYNNSTIDITGPAPVNYPEIAQLLEKYTGKTIKYNNVPPLDYSNFCLSLGMPQGSVTFLSDLFADITNDNAKTVSLKVKEITGQEPKSFESFIKDNFSKIHYNE
ncbi:hypothetical protein CYY_009287 [Polysphondylium violaceum]|uniref:NmrA-like domain-containing protein n=1 Tax=Polysphondylium violaceum TaxID=133409 RepID=A0A8J4PM33_9MYCE|nr:hypothetical protein CYY_009287 [Polysphondylium violaceum]